MIVVIGGTGFLGSRILESVLKREYPVRIFCRGAGDWKGNSIQALRKRGLDVVLGDLANPERIERALEDAKAIINVSGVFRQTEEMNFEDLHVSYLENLLNAAADKSIQRFIHVSCLGAHEDSVSEYFETKWRGEQMVLEAEEFYWTVFRPGFMFGSDRFPLMDSIKPLVRFKPFLPVIGTGLNLVQPVWVDDVAECIVQSIYKRETVGKSYELAGPDQYEMGGLIEMFREGAGIGGNTINIPSELSGKAFDLLSKALPKKAVDLDLAKIVTSDSVTESNDMVENFEVENKSLEDAFEGIIAGYK